MVPLPSSIGSLAPLNSSPRYHVSSQHFKKNYGSGLLAQYNDSVSRLVSTIYSDYPYLPWKFTRAAKGFFEIRENRVRYVDWLRKELGFEHNDQLETGHFIANHGYGLLKMFGGSPRAVIESLSLSGAEGSSLSDRSVRPSNYWVRSSHISFIFPPDPYLRPHWRIRGLFSIP